MPETIGQQLKQARQDKKLSIEKASEAIHIRPHYLQALEADDYSVMPSSAQARGFLRNYASFLGLDLDLALAEIQRARPPELEEVSGPVQQVEILPPPPEPVTRPQHPQPSPSAVPAWRARLESWWAGLRKPRDPDETTPVPPAEPGSEATDASAPEAGPPPHPDAEPDSVPLAEEPAAQSATQPLQEPAAPQAPDTASELPSPPAEIASATPPQPGLRDRLASAFRRPAARKDEPLSETSAPTAETAAPADLASAVEPDVETPQWNTGESAEQIFREIGMELRRRRELLSLTPDEVERHTHVRAVFIQALESGDFEQLPSAVQTRGMLANYAAFLDLDADALLLRFADSLQASHRLRYPHRTGRSRQPLSVRPSMPPLRSFVAGDMIFGLAIVVMVVALVVWGLGRVFAVQAEPVALPTAPSISDVLAGTAGPTPIQQVTLIAVADTPLTSDGETATLGAGTEAPAVDVEIDPNVAVRLTIVATERTFMRVNVDGEEIFNGRVVAGTAYEYNATATVEVLTGNAAALRVTYNGRDLGLLGNLGEVAHFIYTANSIVTPVPAASPTGTATPLLSPTPTGTPTPTPTVTIPPPGG